MQNAEPRDFVSYRHDEHIVMPSHMAVMLHYAHFSAPCKLVLIYDLFSYRKLQHSPFPQQGFLYISPTTSLTSELVREFIVEKKNRTELLFVTGNMKFGYSF